MLTHRPSPAPLRVLRELEPRPEPWDRPKAAPRSAPLALVATTPTSWSRSTARPSRCPPPRAQAARLAVIGLAARVGDGQQHRRLRYGRARRRHPRPGHRGGAVALTGLRFPPNDLKHAHRRSSWLALETLRRRGGPGHATELPRERTGCARRHGLRPGPSPATARSWRVRGLGRAASGVHDPSSGPTMRPKAAFVGITLASAGVRRHHAQHRRQTGSTASLDRRPASSHTVSSRGAQRASVALELAIPGACASGELDAAVIGAVDLSPPSPCTATRSPKLGIDRDVSGDRRRSASSWCVPKTSAATRSSRCSGADSADDAPRQMRSLLHEVASFAAHAALGLLCLRWLIRRRSQRSRSMVEAAVARPARCDHR